MDIDLWWVWAVVAVLIALSELHAPGYYLIWIALGAAVTAAGAAVWDMSIHAQLALFAAASALSCVCGYFVYRRLDVATDSTLNQRGRAMIGQRGTVVADFVDGCGKVRLGDSVWLAEGPDLAQGAPVVVTSVRGTSVLVVPAQAIGTGTT
jgi:membrane protein implicated in regulation of membrane protease activity